MLISPILGCKPIALMTCTKTLWRGSWSLELRVSPSMSDDMDKDMASICHNGTPQLPNSLTPKSVLKA